MSIFHNLLASYSKRYLPRWIVFCIDMAMVFTLYFVAYLLRTNFDAALTFHSVSVFQAVMTTLIYSGGFIFWQSYKGIVRYTNQYDAIRFIWVIVFAFVVLATMSGIAQWVSSKNSILFQMPISVLIIQAVLLFVGLVGSRLIVRDMYDRYIKANGSIRIKTLIYGAGAAGIITKNTLDKETTSTLHVIGFIDDSREKVGKVLEGVPVYSPLEVFRKDFILRNRIREVIISIQNLKPDRKQEIIEQCLALNLRVKQIPSVQKLINGELSYKQIRDVKIEDLLEREPIKLNSDAVRSYITGKRVLITGAAGSIGSEIARQVLHYSPDEVVFLDQAESPLFELEHELRYCLEPSLLKPARFIVANVKDLFRMEGVFRTYHPQVVFHAAAYKHVPLMEDNPYEAVRVNVFGTKLLADLSVEFKVEKFVMVSTDKAVNPTSVMGATKRIAEIYTQSLNRYQAGTRFITTRFGNVLGSNGSVIPLFKKQIEKGGPVTLTHKDIRRYFMTIPEACNLVLEAGAMGQGGEIYVFDMGKPVKIYDLACKMIQLSGLELGKDIDIQIVGLRPGEKLYEELLNNHENTLPTHHPKIMVGKVREYDEDVVKSQLEKLSDALVQQNDFEIVRLMKEMVPEYRSNNSKFSILDEIGKSSDKG